MAAPHAFLDILANSQVRDAYLAGRISIILSSDLEKILWANGAGANFMGFHTVADSIGVDSGFDNLTRLQIENGLSTQRPVKVGGIPAAESFLVNAITMEHLGNVVFLRSIAAVASENGFVDLTNGLSDDFTEAAVIDLEGNILSATKGFLPDFAVDDELISLLHDAQSGNGIKKSLLKNYSDLPVGILELNKQPAIFLLIAAKPDHDDEEKALEADGTQPFSFNQNHLPLRFSWQMDETSCFTDVSSELATAVGPKYSDIIDKSFTNLAKEWNMDSNGAMRALLKSHKAWAQVKIIWPVDDGEHHVEVEFSALPIYSRQRKFNGYRGFGQITVAKAAAKEDILNLSRKRGPKGLNEQEKEAFNAIARKLKADILAVELPRNLRQAKNEEMEQARLEKNRLLEKSNQEADQAVEDVQSIAVGESANQTAAPESVAHTKSAETDAIVATEAKELDANIADEMANLAAELSKLDNDRNGVDSTSADSKLAADSSLDQTALAISETKFSEPLADMATDQDDDTLDNSHGVEPEALNHAPAESVLRPSMTLDEEYGFAEDLEFDDENSDSAIDALLNNYDRSSYAAISPNNPMSSVVASKPKAQQEISGRVSATMANDDDLVMTMLPDDDLETALEYEWARDDELMSRAPNIEQGSKKDAFAGAANEMITAANGTSYHDGANDGVDALDSVDVAKPSNSELENIDVQQRDQADSNQNDADEKIDHFIDDKDEEPQSIEDALAALRRSLEENGIEAVTPHQNEALDFWDESAETLPSQALNNNTVIANGEPSIDELMRAATFADEGENGDVPVLQTMRLGNSFDQESDEVAYQTKARAVTRFSDDDTNEPDTYRNRLNLRPVEKSKALVDDGVPVKNFSTGTVSDAILPILPSPRIEFTLLQQLPLPILIYRDNRVLFTSDELLRLTGFPTLDSFRAHGILSVILREWLPRNILIGANDEIWSVRPQMRGVTWADGREASMISFGHLEKQDSIDKEDFEALQRKAVELSILLNLISDGVVILDDNGLIHSVNEAAQRMFGLEADEIKGHDFRQFFADKSLDIVEQYFNSITQSAEKPPFGEGYEVEAIRSNGDGISLFVSFGKMELDEGYFLMLRDLSVIHSAASELVVARHQAEEESLRKSRYLALVSHEIRTPLNAIIGLSELILEEKFGALNNDRYRGYLRDIVNSGSHIMTLINDLLDAAKIAEGRTTIDIRDVAIAPILKEVLGLMTPQANTGRIIMRSNIAHNLPDIAADKRSVKQIILNLLSNAIRFTPPGGQIIVSALHHDNGGVLLRVRDSGVGMSETEMEEAMLPFHQIAKPAQIAEGEDGYSRGTGLGLPLTKALADANNARFNLHSETGKGTVAEVLFPLAVNRLDDDRVS